MENFRGLGGRLRSGSRGQPEARRQRPRRRPGTGRRRPGGVFRFAAVSLSAALAVTLSPNVRAGAADAHAAGSGAGGRLPLWRVEQPGRDDARLFVLATVALSEQDRLRFDPAVQDAFEHAQRLVLPNDAALSKQNALIGWKAHLAPGDLLSHWLPEDVAAAYVAAVGRAGYPPTYANVTAPWFAARMVRAADLRRTAFAPEREFEVYFAHLAEERAEPKTILPLEESAASYDRAAALSRELQVEVMRRALADSARADADLPAAAAAWKAGDFETLDAILRRSDHAHPEWAASRVRTTADEAARLADGVRRLLAEAGAHQDFLLAGSRYVLGGDGLLDRLRDAGLQVSPVPARGGVGAPYPAPPLPAAGLPPGRSDGHRVLLVGIDGASPRVVGPLLEQGRLPNLSEMAHRGVSGPLRSRKPLYSPRIWNTIATGKVPSKHGIEGFTYRDAQGHQRLYLSVNRKVHALWNIASKAGMRVAVLNWWNTYPPEIVNGVMVSDHAKPTRLAELRKLTGAEGFDKHALGATVFPEAWRARVADVYARRLVIPGQEDPFLGNLGLPPWLQKEELSKRYRDDAAVARLALEIEAKEAPDLMMVYLPGIDRVSHRLWAGMEPPDAYAKPLDLSKMQHDAARDALERYYVYTDALIGLLSRDFGPDDLVLVVSDHGFEAGRHLGDLTGVHDSDKAQDGILFGRGPGVPAGGSARGTTVDDVTPTILAWLGMPLARDMDGKVAPFVEADRRGAAVAPIATYDTEPVQRIGNARSGHEEEILDQLRALGYID